MANRLLSCVLLSGVAVLAIPGAAAQAKPYTILHSFSRGSGDGDSPYTPPVLAASGDLYGTNSPFSTPSLEAQTAAIRGAICCGLETISTAPPRLAATGPVRAALSSG